MSSRGHCLPSTTGGIPPTVFPSVLVLLRFLLYSGVGGRIRHWSLAPKKHSSYPSFTKSFMQIVPPSLWGSGLSLGTEEIAIRHHICLPISIISTPGICAQNFVLVAPVPPPRHIHLCTWEFGGPRPIVHKTPPASGSCESSAGPSTELAWWEGTRKLLSREHLLDPPGGSTHFLHLQRRVLCRAFCNTCPIPHVQPFYLALKILTSWLLLMTAKFGLPS